MNLYNLSREGCSSSFPSFPNPHAVLFSLKADTGPRCGAIVLFHCFSLRCLTSLGVGEKEESRS